MEELRTSVENLINEYSGLKGIFIKDIETGDAISINGDKRFHAASIIKLPILYEALLQLQNNEIHLDDKYTLDEDDIVGGSGILQLLSIGDTVTLKDLLTLMICVSDNTATNMLHDILGKDKINKSISKLGLSSTLFARKLMIVMPGLYSYTTANDIGKLLEEFIVCSTLSDTSAKLGLDILSKQQYNDRISADLIECGCCKNYLGTKNICPVCNSNTSDVDPIYIPFAHKTGSIHGVVHDAGILTLHNKKIIAVCLTSNLSTDTEGIIMENRLGKLIYDYFN